MTSKLHEDAANVLHFWFDELTPQQWFKKSPSLDEKITSRFKDIHDQACAGELYGWRKTALGRLAEIIVLDQFSRNLYRGSARSFSQDAQALTLSQELIASGLDQDMDMRQRHCVYLPFMHSESLQMHRYAKPLFDSLNNADISRFEDRHVAILERFGRYPHRNQVLGRTSTPQELEFLQQPGSGF